MTKGFTLAALLLSACATADGEISVGPERGDHAGVDDIARVTGVVHGVTTGRVVLGNDAWLEGRDVEAGGFSFEGVPDGTYFVRLEVAGYSAPAQTVTVENGAARVILTATALPAGFSYLWSRDASQGGHEQGSAIGSARSQLLDRYGITLSDEDQPWTAEHAARLLQTMRAVPQRASSNFAPAPMPATTWVLGSGPFSRDGHMVFMPAQAFTSDGARFFASELHTEVVNMVTSAGSDRTAVNRILHERFDLRAYLFHDAELVDLIGHLEDMPSRLRAMSSLRTMIRREGGAAVRATVAQGYLEIGTTAFTIDHADAQFEMLREKARFVVTPQLQAEWGQGDVATAIAGYLVNPDIMSTAAEQMMSGLHLDATRPISHVAIQAEGRTVTVELGLTIEASSASIFLFNDAGQYTLLSLNPTGDGGVRGTITLREGGRWRPDFIVLRDQTGAASATDVSEVGWQLEVE